MGNIIVSSPIGGPSSRTTNGLMSFARGGSGHRDCTGTGLPSDDHPSRFYRVPYAEFKKAVGEGNISSGDKNLVFPCSRVEIQAGVQG